MSESLDDEILSINAIYSENTLTQCPDTPVTCSLLLPGESHISLKLEFPDNYPDQPPSILGTQTVGDHVPKGFGQDTVDLARHVLSEIYVPGVPCIFDFLDTITPKLDDLLSTIAEATRPATSVTTQDAQISGQQTSHISVSAGSDVAQHEGLPQELDRPPPWVISEPVEDRKSVFIARAATVSSPDEAKAFLRHLLTTEKRVAKATHNITAWRIRGQNDVTYQDCDDDGEDAAGGRLLHLLQLMDAWDVMVVVTRWYGGVKLGSDRFRLINAVARDALVKGGHVKEATKKTGNKKRGG